MWERPSGRRSHFTEQESEACSVSPLPRPRHLFCFWRRPSSWPRGAGRQEGRPELEPEPEPKSVQLPTVWNPGGARGRVRMCPTTHRGAGRGGDRGPAPRVAPGARTLTAPSGAAGQRGVTRGLSGPGNRSEKLWRRNKTSAGTVQRGSRWVRIRSPKARPTGRVAEAGAGLGVGCSRGGSQRADPPAARCGQGRLNTAPSTIPAALSPRLFRMSKSQGWSVKTRRSLERN